MKTIKKTGLLIGLSLVLIQTSQAQTLKDALKYTENHHFEDASKLFHQLIAKTPADAHLYYYMGENMYKSERFDSAAFYYDKGITVDAKIGLNYVGKGKIALTKNDEATAKPLFEKALFHHTHDAKALMAIAEAYIDNEWKNMKYAQECLAKAEALERNNPNIYLLIGDAALLGTNDGLKALNNYEKARDMEPKNPKPLIHIGQLYERARSYDLSLAEYQKAISLDTTFAPSYLKLADLYYQFGKYKEAKDYMGIYVKLTGNSLFARIKYAKYLFLAKEYDASIFEIEDIMTLDNTINILYRLLAYSYSETKDCPNALKNIEKFMKDAPISGDKITADDYRYYGKILQCVNKDSLSTVQFIIPNLQKALEMDSTKLDVYGFLYDAYIKIKLYDQARDILLKKFTLVKEPLASDIFRIGLAYYQKAAILKDSLLFLKADSVFTIFTTKQPDDVRGYLYRARSNAGLDPETKLGLAKLHYETVIAIGSSDVEKNKKFLVEAHYYLAYSYYLLKDKAKATENLNKVVEYDPENKNAPSLKKFIDKLP